MHTPTPWHVNELLPSATQINSERGPVAGEVSPDNAAFIVTTCNAHDALVAACTELLDALEASTYDYEWVDIKEQAHAALALAAPQEAVR